MANRLLSGRTKTILYGLVIFLLATLFVVFLVAFIHERNKDNESPSSTPPSPTTTLPLLSTTNLPTTNPPLIEPDIRLNDSIVPEKYILEIISNPNEQYFNGTVQIYLRVVEEQINEITLHCKNLFLTRYSIDSSQNIIKHEIDTKRELCKFYLDQPLSKGLHYLEIIYSGTFGLGQITGFYRSQYKTSKNQVRYLTVTKFEPTYARMAFPCFDEPEFKAIFEISIIHPSEMIALSNEIESKIETIENGLSKTTFAKTAKMSTYLVAFVISDFEYKETRTKFGTRIRVYSSPDQIEKTHYALETAANLLSFYENYTGIPYTFTKLDLIGIPQFVAGAMENWGLITYKEIYVLFDKENSNINDMRRITDVIAHELSHMWFGNLVTLKWWNDLWIQEGFASFIEYYGKNYVNSSWNAWNRFLIDDLHGAFRYDSLDNSHALTPEQDTILMPDQIASMFDTITYSKGASILYMIRNIIGEEKFQAAIRKYLMENQFSVVNTEQMIKYFTDDIKQITGIDGKNFMNKWIYDNGFPIISVERVLVENSKYYKPISKRLILKQTNYTSNKSADILTEPWNVYVSVIQPKHSKVSFVFNQSSSVIDLDFSLDANDWIKLNPDGKDYYLVNYQPQDWKLLIKELKKNPNIFSIGDRANILHDAFRLAEISLYNYEDLFDLLEYLPKEQHYIPWSVASNIIISLDMKLGQTGVTLIQYREFIKSLIVDLYDSKVDLTSSTNQINYDQILLQSNLISIACGLGYEKCIQQCYQKFRDWLDRGKKMDANLKFYIYKYGLQASTNETDWIRLWDQYKSEKDAIEKSKLISALSATKNPNLLSLLISYSQDQTKINNEIFFSVQQSIASNSNIGRNLVWDYIKNYWKDLVQRFGLNDPRLGNYVRSVTSGFRTESRLEEFLNFIQKYPESGAGEKARAQAMETIRKNIEWIENNRENIEKSLNKRDTYLKPWLNWRLDESIRPIHYKINLTVDVDQEKFFGSVRIQIDVKRAIRYLILHSKELNIKSSAVYSDTSDRIQMSQLFNSSFAYETNHFWVIPMKEIILPNNYIAELSFEGLLGKDLNGLYLSRYNDIHTNSYIKLATTQFQAGYARKVFPCFDEPQFKATFSISVQHRSNYSVISNMPVKYIRKFSNEMKQTVFKKSVPMPTYLLALVVSNFVYKSSLLVSNFSIYTYNPDINLKKVDYALTIGPKILDFYAQKYFDIGYPLPKMDLISIPDFSMGAMENWGLITFRDVYILYDETGSSISKIKICQIISHELAHMWFGNLVTVKWWDDLWLNEGFATFMQYKATEWLEPNWKYHEYFVLNEIAKVYEMDSLPSTHSILTKVTDDNSIQSVFDTVTYAKGATIIRMLEAMLGPEKFRIGIKNYIKKYSYANTVTEDLWSELSNVAMKTSSLNIGQFMDVWVRKEGFPVITITLLKNGSLEFSQERFLKDFSNSNSSSTWSIPVTYRLINTNIQEINNDVENFNFQNKKLTVNEIKFGQDDIIKFNIDQKGLYVVNYPLEEWDRWIKLLNNESSIVWNKTSTLDRHNLLIDAFYLARSGRLSYKRCLQLAQFLKHERSFIVWKTASDMLNHLDVFITEQDPGIAFNNWILNKLIGNIYDEVEWEAKPQEDLNQRLLRALIIDLACFHGHQQCIRNSSKMFDEYMKEQSGHYDEDIVPIFLYHTISNNFTKERFEFLHNRYLTATSTNEKMKYLKAMTAVRNETMLKTLITSSLNVDYLRSQDFFTFLIYLAMNPIGRDIAWKFYQQNYQQIVDRYKLDNSNLGKILYYYAFYFTTEQRRQEILNLFELYPEAGASTLYRQQAMELMDANIRWSKLFYKDVIKFLTIGCQSKLCPWNEYRLNKKIQPEKYDLIIQINTTTFQFNGTVRIEINVFDEVDYIILNAENTLNISSSIVQLIDKQEMISTGKPFYYTPMEYYVIPLKKKTDTGQRYMIEAQFNGNFLNSGLVGLYRGWYDSPKTDKRINLGATQFEMTHARKMFPCFDEPLFKTNISIMVIHDKRMNTTLSNMNIIWSKSHESMPHWMVTKYETTPPMATYLIAILVSDFHCSTVMVKNNLPISTCSSPLHNAQKHRYSLDVTPKILNYLENYTQIAYSFPKLDQIALPQFSAGAMENWGLVKYREEKLLWSEDEDQSDKQKKICTVISHELAHMWFGNLVTIEFWKDLWLKEALAAYMEYNTVNYVHPEWKFWDTFASNSVYRAILADFIQESAPLVREISTPEMLKFDSSIIYKKGSTVLNMFEQTMGSEHFLKSIREYLKQYRFKVVTTENLVKAFEKNWIYTEIDLKTFMDSWIKQPGFPYLNITYDEQNGKYSYVQHRFIDTGEMLKKEFTYVIPFSFYTFDSTNKTLVQSSIQFLSEKSGNLTNLTSSIVKINPNFNGFYLVNYPAKQWWEIVENLVSNQKNIVSLLSVNDRSELILSSYFLSRAKLAPYFINWNLFNYLVHETHYIPWSFFSNFVDNLKIGRTEYRESYLHFKRRLSSVHYDSLKFWDDSQGTIMEKIFRKNIIYQACESGNKQCLKDAYEKFSQWKKNSSFIPPNLFMVTLCYGIKFSTNETDYEYVWNRFLKEDNNSENKTGYLEALSYTSDSILAKKYLDLALNETLVPVNHFIYLFKYLIHRYEHETMIWNYFIENYSMLARKLSSSQMDSIITTFSDQVISEKRKLEIWNFIKDQQTGVSISGQASSFANIEFNLQWMSQNKKKVGEWLSNNACGTMKPEPCPWAKVRINADSVLPIRYDLTIQVNLTTNLYNGSVHIEIEAKKFFQYIVLHAAKMLQVDLVSVQKTNSENKTSFVDEVSMFRYLPNHYIVLEFNQEQSSGSYVLNFNFKANLLDTNLSGLYISNYTDGQKNHKIASTQFEFYDARKMFPCFDEPAFKSKFMINIIHDDTMNTVLSNMEISKQNQLKGTGWNKTEFKETVPMATYLVAMVVSDFVCKQTTSGNNITYKICAPPLQNHKLDYALEKAPLCLEHLEKILGQTYPMNKVDLVAIPDFHYGAMENWGLIIFRESALLFHENDTTSERKMGIMNTIAHELAHFWFGNLVTCQWWDYIALNEALATYIQYTTLNAAEPDWKIFDMFLMSDFEYALNADAKDNHPIIRNVTTTNQIEQYDSKIIYSKGATIFRMIESLMGTKDFYDALKEYLKDFKFKNVKPENLFDKFDKFFKTPDENIKKMSVLLQEWFFHNGLPYINVTEMKNGNGYTILQDQFILQKTKKETKPFWKIPITFYTDTNWNKTKTKFLFKKKMNLINEFNSFPIKLNAGHQGFYLVNYSPKVWNKWIETLQSEYHKLPISDRAGLLLDSFYLARANLLSYNVPLNLAKYLSNERHITPWTIAIRSFTFLKNYFRQESLYQKKFNNYLQELVEPIYKEMEWKDEIQSSVVQRRLRSSILDFACSIQLDGCLNKINVEFKEWIQEQQNGTGKIIAPNLLNIVLKYGLKYSNSSDQWLYVWSKYLNESSATFRSIYINALVNTEDEKLLKMLITEALDSNVIRSQDTYSVLVTAANTDSSKSLKILWEFFKENYMRMIGSGSPLKLNQVYGLLNRISSRYFFTNEQKFEMQDFFARYASDFGLTESQRQNILNTIDNNINWMKQRMIEVERFLLCGSDVCPFTEFRLNPNVIPRKYSLSIEVNLDQEMFEGSIEIDVQLNENIKYVIVHASSSLNITKSQVFDSNTNQMLEIKQNFSYIPFEFWILEMTKQIDIEKIKLKYEFNSKLATDMLGFYLSKYYDPNQKTEIKLASTQFQDTYARRAFPCFDEPSFKSVFKVKIKHSSKYKAMSNNKIISENKTDNYTLTEFEETPKMVTYLLAFTISDFKCKSNHTNSSIEINVCSSPPEIQNTDYSLSKTPELIMAYEKKLNYSYQLPKMDLIAIPDFFVGAMENWGLLTFRETALLWNEFNSSAANKMGVLSVVAHEIAHMWFGNLITCHWWTDLWLNEAFATYLEWYFVDLIEPDWNYKQLFYITDYIAGMDADASITAHPLARSLINSPSEIQYITNIIYQKGSSILRMFEFVLTDENFFNRLIVYLRDNAFKTVNTATLLDTLSQVTVPGLNDTLGFLESWSLKAGFPYLTIKKESKFEYTIVQQRFLSSGNSSNNEIWIVPLSYYMDYSKSNDYKIEFLINNEQRIKLATEINESLPIKFNCDSRGFYIVNYPLDEWKQWAELFKEETKMNQLKLTSQDYSQLIYDAFRLANVDLLPFEIVFDLLSILKTNRMLSVWKTGSFILDHLWPYFRGNPSDDKNNMNSLMKKAFQTFANELVKDAYRDFNLQSSERMKSINEQRLLSTISTFGCAYGFDLCLAEAQVEYRKWRNGFQALSPNIITIVLQYGLQQSTNVEDWMHLWNIYIEEHSTIFKLNYLRALTQTENKDLLYLLLERANNQTLVRRQDYLLLYRYILRTSIGFEVGWKYFQENYRNILFNRLSSSNMGRLINYFANYLHTNEQKESFKRFFQIHSNTGVSEVDLKKALETIENNVQWDKKYRMDVFQAIQRINKQMTTIK